MPRDYGTFYQRRAPRFAPAGLIQAGPPLDCHLPSHEQRCVITVVHMSKLFTTSFLLLSLTSCFIDYGRSSFTIEVSKGGTAFPCTLYLVDLEPESKGRGATGVHIKELTTTEEGATAFGLPHNGKFLLLFGNPEGGLFDYSIEFIEQPPTGYSMTIEADLAESKHLSFPEDFV